jgi:hypothetical protein
VYVCLLYQNYLVYVCLLYQEIELSCVCVFIDTINTHTHDSSPDIINTLTQDISPDTINTLTQDSSPDTINTGMCVYCIRR